MDDLIIPPIFPKGIQAFFTTKRNYQEVYTLFTVPVFKPVQRHTSRVIVLDGMEPQIADGVITDKTDVVLSIETADCVPVLLCDPERPAIGAVHAGWRGTAEGILKNAIKAMEGTFSSDPSRLLIAIGPSIGGCCYEVDEPVYRAITRITGSVYKPSGEKYLVDLKKENLLQALMEGIRRENIWVSSECTLCLHERFYSYRYSKNNTGRQGGFIYIKAA